MIITKYNVNAAAMSRKCAFFFLSFSEAAAILYNESFVRVFGVWKLEIISERKCN